MRRPRRNIRSAGADGPFAFLLRLLKGATPVMLSVCLVTVGVDPANLFRGTGYERGIAELLAQGRNVAAIANHDDRLVQRYYAAKVERAPDVLVLGSSRAMQIRRDDAAAAGLGPTFFNASVSEGTLEDFEAILELYLKRGFIPHTVVLGVDIWDLQATDWLAGWKSLRWERDSLLEEMGRDPGGGSLDRWRFLLRYGQALSPSYLQEALSRLARSLVEGEPPRPMFYPTGGTALDVAVKLADGSLVYDKAMRDRSTEETEREAVSYATRWREGIDRVGLLQADRQAEFEALLDLLERRGIEVVLYLGPYHPTTYAYFLRERNLRLGGAVEDYLRAEAKRRGISILGSYDPSRAGVEAGDFFDALHVRESGVEKIFRASGQGE